MQNAEIYPTERNGKKLQIRGFPTKWTEDMTHEDISWYLFDLLSKYGPIYNVAVTQSKKDSLIYAVVDMLYEKDMYRIEQELLDQNNSLPLQGWNAALSFRRLDGNIGNEKYSKENENPAYSQSTEQPKRCQSVFEIVTPPQTEEKTTEASKSVSQLSTSSAKGQDLPPITYTSSELIGLRDSSARSVLGPEFSSILRENGESQTENNQEPEKRGKPFASGNRPFKGRQNPTWN